MSKHTIKIKDGHVLFVYDDELGDLMDEGTVAVCRASHVEPHPTRTGWLADMRPSGGPVLGLAGEWQPTHDKGLAELPEEDMQHIGMLDPFKTRQEALAAEREWLTKEKGL